MQDLVYEVMSKEQKVNSLKEEGNVYFRSKDFLNAEKKYSEALKEIEKESTPKLTCNLFVNRAACYLKLEHYENCINDCSFVINSSDSSFKPKALYRRAQAFYYLKSWKESRLDLLTLLQLEPSNAEAQQLMREVIMQIQKSNTVNEAEKFFSGLKGDGEEVLNSLKGLMELCGEEESHAVQFGKSRGLMLLQSLVSDERFESSCSKLLAVLTKHQRFVQSFVQINPTLSQLDCVVFEDVTFNTLADGTVPFISLFFFYRSTSFETLRAAVLTTMNILRALPVGTVGEMTDQLAEPHLFLNRSYGNFVLKAFLRVLKMQDEKHFKFACEAFSAFISEQPNYYDPVKPIDIRLETIEERKARVKQASLLNLRSKTHSFWALENRSLEVFIDALENQDQLIHINAFSTLGKLIKHYDNVEDMKNRLAEFLSEGNDLEQSKRRALLEAALLFSHPELGSWALEQPNGITQLLHLIDTQNDHYLEIASEVLCLAANADSTASLIKPLIEANVLDRLLASANPAVKSNAAAALTKFSIKAKALTYESPENGAILNSIQSTLKNSLDGSNRVLAISVERCVETLAALSGKTYIKEEIMYGSNRSKAIIADLIKINLPEDSVANYGLSHVFASLTVTNRELKALALADKEMTLEQYEKLQELQRIKGKDENGETFEEKKDEVDYDNQDLCRKRIVKLVSLGALSSLFKLAQMNSFQVKENACKTLRQINVVESVRGIFLQDGGLKICGQIANDELLERKIRFEAAHAIAKALVTTNPNLLNEHHRLNAFRPLLLLCKEVDASQLQQFEALLSITNLLSCGEKEQNLFVEEKGVTAVHYLIFSSNFMVRRAATEALCNLGGHEALVQILRDAEKLKLWLALTEEWEISEGTKSETFLIARAALATLAMTSFDDGVAKAMIEADCAKSFNLVMSTNNRELVHRVLVAVSELLSGDRREVGTHLVASGFLESLAECTVITEELKELAEAIMKTIALTMKSENSEIASID